MTTDEYEYYYPLTGQIKDVIKTYLDEHEMNIDTLLPLTSSSATKIKKTLLQQITTPEQFQGLTEQLHEIPVKKEVYQLTEEEHREIQAKIYKKFAGEKLGEYVTAASLTSKKETKLFPGSFHILDIYITAMTLGVFGFFIGVHQNKERRLALQYGGVGFIVGLVLDAIIHFLRLNQQRIENKYKQNNQHTQTPEEKAAKKND